MKKIKVLIVLTAVFMTILSGCMTTGYTNTGRDYAGDRPNNNFNNASSTTKGTPSLIKPSDENENKTDSSPSLINQEENIIDVNYLESRHNFSEGRAWVVFSSKFGGYKTALIDTEGNFLWKSESIKKLYNSTVRSSEFKNGLAYFTLYGNTETINIIDSDGNITFTAPNSDDFKILGHDNGLFLVAKHVSNFDANEWQMGTIDKYGKTVVPFKALEIYEDLPEPVEPPSGDPPDPNYDYWGYLEYYRQLEEYEKYQFELEHRAPITVDFSDARCVVQDLGENIFCISSSQKYYILLNIKTDEIIYSSVFDYDVLSLVFLTNFENGYATVLLHDPKNDNDRDKYAYSIAVLDTKRKLYGTNLKQLDRISVSLC